ncbi:hypothetical protein [Actinocorallia sp. A-T 12471]|uniref:hypothetical protein n=1 Tax=Actinocorallia sp. A-T 12471 TaxID=3089813 RepID=UPI0029CBBF79|nr:hypothetical protein [Actinocorallia sp. A-T 12471]MDX6738738.1 hypothetical protein [Actinocorallia sp. A-T 12471]
MSADPPPGAPGPSSGRPATTYEFAFAPRYRPLLALMGIRPANSRVTLDDRVLRAVFGRWKLETPLANVASATPSGPYKAYRAIGTRLSFADSGLTFGSALTGVCVSFRTPVRCFGPRPHAALTVTVAAPEAFAADLTTRLPTP